MTDLEHLAKIRECLQTFKSEALGEKEPPLLEAFAALHELEARAHEREDDFVWPVRVKDAALGLYGTLGDRDYKALDRRIRHAWRLWDDDYGPLSPEQAEYATDVLCSAFQGLADVDNPRPFVYARLDGRLYDQRVRDGFVRRAGGPVELRSVA